MVLNTFHETLRDRLISYFESINLRHKPKLVRRHRPWPRKWCHQHRGRPCQVTF